MESDDNNTNQNSAIIIEPVKELSWTQMPNGYSSLQAIKETEKLSTKKKQIVPISKEGKEKKVLDNSVKFKVDKIVLTEWGVGKITSVCNESRSCKVKIEGEEVPFGFDVISPFIIIFFCVLTKTKTDWIALKFNMSDTIETVRRKISVIYMCHYSQILLVYAGENLTSNADSLSKLGLFAGDEMLGIVKDPQEYAYLLFSSEKKVNLSSGSNSISFHVNENITLTGMLFYRNDSVDVMYDLTISELNTDSTVNVLYQVFNLLIKAVNPVDEIDTIKVAFPNVPIKKGRDYEIKQSFNHSLVNQFIGLKSNDNKDSSNGVKFAFFETNQKYLQKKSNEYNITQSLLSGLYYVIQSGKE